MIAYLDPGTGSIILQVIVGGIAGIAVFFKLLGSKLMFWKKDKPSDADETTEADAEADEATEPAEASTEAPTKA